MISSPSQICTDSIPAGRANLNSFPLWPSRRGMHSGPSRRNIVSSFNCLPDGDGRFKKGNSPASIHPLSFSDENVRNSRGIQAVPNLEFHLQPFLPGTRGSSVFVVIHGLIGHQPLVVLRNASSRNSNLVSP